jgi:hypothetical protein
MLDFGVGINGRRRRRYSRTGAEGLAFRLQRLLLAITRPATVPVARLHGSGRSSTSPQSRHSRSSRP